jgi:hypothetical protein
LITKKFKSVKVLITLWAIALITYIVVANRGDFIQLAHLLATIPMIYLPTNVWQKKIFEDRLNNNIGE